MNIKRQRWSSRAERNMGPYTTGEVARMFRVAPRTVATWCDNGLIPGVYRIPHAGPAKCPPDRRIPHFGLLEFCKQFGVPVPAQMTWLVVGINLGSVDGFEQVRCPANALDVGMAIQEATYAAALFDSSELPLGVCVHAARTIRDRSGGKTTTVLILTEDFNPSAGDWPDGKNFDLVFPFAAQTGQIKSAILKFQPPPLRSPTCPAEANGTASAVLSSLNGSYEYSKNSTGSVT